MYNYSKRFQLQTHRGMNRRRAKRPMGTKFKVLPVPPAVRMVNGWCQKLTTT